MALIVIGGQSRNVGKTSVVAELIAAFPQYNWTAFKISQHGHGATGNAAWSVSEEKNPAGTTDTARFLQAGAVRAWWVRSEPGRLAEAMPELRSKLAEAKNAIIESNRIVEFLRPDLYLAVLDPAIADFKRSAQDFLCQADAVILHQTKENLSSRHGVRLEAADKRPVFVIHPPPYVTLEIVEFVAERLGQRCVPRG